METTTEGEGGVFPLFTATCTNDPNTGFFEGTFTGANGVALGIKLKGFSTSDKTYRCGQSSDNTEGDLGLLFDECAVSLVVPDADVATNTYAMHRAEADIRAFSYMGDCSISTRYEAPRVTANLDCAGLIQTHLEGAPRNPIVAEVTASLLGQSSVYCDL